MSTDLFTTLAERLDSLAGKTPELHAELVRHESVLSVDDFGVEDAWALGTAMRTKAAELGLPVSISIMVGPQRAFHAALPGSTANFDLWANRKINAAQLFAHSSFWVAVNDVIRSSNIHDRLSASDYATDGGGFPLLSKKGSVLGAIGFSGIEAAHDHAFVVAALATYLGREAQLHN